MLNYKLITSLSFGVALALATTGCATKDTNLLNEKDQTIMQLQKKLNDKNDEIAQLNANKVAQDKTTAMQKDENAISNSLVPQNAKPGECYAKVLVPEKFEEKTKTRLVQDEKNEIVVTPATYKVIDKKVSLRAASTKLEIIPAVYEDQTEEILVQAERTELVLIPATYKTIEEEILIEDEKEVIKTIPATYKEVSEEVLITPAHTAWKQGRGEIEKVNNSTGDIMCLIEVPAIYKTVTKKVLDTEAYTQKEIIPAVYKTIKSRVVDIPSHTEEKVIPAVYATITKKVLVTPETTNEIKIPAICKLVKVKVIDTPSSEEVVYTPSVYEDYTTTIKTEDSYLRWQPILCETNTKPDIISDLQRTLRGKGYNVRNINGEYDKDTKEAVKQYQIDNKLSQGALTLKTLESLGL